MHSLSALYCMLNIRKLYLERLNIGLSMLLSGL